MILETRTKTITEIKLYFFIGLPKDNVIIASPYRDKIIDSYKEFITQKELLSYSDSLFDEEQNNVDIESSIFTHWVSLDQYDNMMKISDKLEEDVFLITSFYLE